MWTELGIPKGDVEAWQAIGFGPFEAALAFGDGSTPLIAVLHPHPLLKTAAAWKQAGLGTAEGISWHRAGFNVKEAIEWRQAGVSLNEARILQRPYGKFPDFRTRNTKPGAPQPAGLGR